MKVWDCKRTDFRYAHVKRDGHMMIISIKDSGMPEVLSKNYNKKDLSWHPVWHNLVTKIPPGTVMYCELWRPGKPAAYISSGLVNKDTEMRLEVFAVPTGLPYSLELAHVALECRRWGLDFVPFYDKRDEPLSLGPWPDEDITKCPLYPDSEGYVLKNSNMSEPFKYKPFKTADLLITGINAGKGKHLGKIGAIICSIEDKTALTGAQGALTEVGNVSGMSDSMRDWMTMQHAAGKLIGRIAEVRYQYVNSKGRLRHASFVRMRDDKDVPDNELS